MEYKDLPYGWVSCLIEKVADVVGGGTPKSTEPTNFTIPNTEISWLTPADLSGYKKIYISYGARDLTKKGYSSSSAKLMPKGSVLFTSRAPIGYIAIADKEVSTNQGFKSFVFNENVLPKYAYYFLSFKKDDIASLGTGTTFKEISGKTAKSLGFLFIPLAEQQEIVRIIESHLQLVDQIKSRLDALPKILEQFRQSVLASAVSGKLTEDWRISQNVRVINWLQTTVGEVSKFQQGLQIAKSERVVEMGEGILPILRTINYENNFSRDVHYVKVNEKSIIANPEDIILSRTGTVGRVLTGFEGVMHNNSFRLNYNSELLVREFLIFFLEAPDCQTYIRNNSGRTTQPDLTHKAFGACPIAIPSDEEQKEIVKRVENFFTLADQIESKIKHAQERVNLLTQSILAKAFRGEFTAQWREDNPDLISGENSAEALLKRIEEAKKGAKKTR